MREEQAAAIARAAADPYARPTGCGQIRLELADLDAALGADVDSPPTKRAGAGEVAEDLTAEVVSDLVGLPYRGVVRRITGAHEEERRARRAVLAAFARRAYLKGFGAALACPDPHAR